MMRTGFGYGPFDGDPVTGEEVPEGMVRDFMGELRPWQEWSRVSRNGEELSSRSHTELRTDKDGKVYLYVDSEESGQVLYVRAVEGGIELELNGARGKLTLS